MSSSTELGINISALAGLTNTQGCICRFSSLYRSHTFVLHNCSNHSPLMLQCSLVAPAAQRARNRITYMHGNRNPCNSFLMVKMASGMDPGCVRPTTTTTTTTTKNDDVAHGGHPANTRSCSLGLKHIFDIRHPNDV